MHGLYHIAGVLLLGTPALVLAAATGTASQPQSLGPVMVTATRTPHTSGSTLAATTVITRADIERSQAQSVAGLLARAPGVIVTNAGGPGKLTSVFMRGTDSDHVLVLIDGVRYGSATAGLAAFQDLPVSAIKRIEIVRGPRSSLYGSDAIGGVIQIFTRDGQGRGSHGLTPYFSVGAGSYGTYDGNVGVSGATRRAHYDLNLGGTDSRGFNSCSGRPFGAPGGGAGCFADQPDNDGYSRLSGSLHAGYRFDDGLQINAHYLRADGDNQYDGSTANESHTVQEVYGASADAQLAAPWHTTLTLGHGRDASRDTFNGVFASRFETRRNSISLQNDFSLNADNLLTLGADYRQEEVVSSTAFDQTRRHNSGVFGQYQGNWGRNEINLAARGDDNQQFGGHATGSVSYGFHLSDVYTVTASYGTAFKAPEFNDLYYPGYANPNLDPERSASYELGLKATPKWGHWSLHAYQTRVKDLIVLDSSYIPQNISQSRQRGVEAAVEARLGPWRLAGNATWLDAENRGRGANRGNELPRRPQYSADFSLDRTFGRYQAGGDLHVVGARYDDAANRHRLGGYALLGLHGAVRLSPAWQLQAKLANVFDRRYETVAFYNQPGRSVFFTLRYAPNGS